MAASLPTSTMRPIVRRRSGLLRVAAGACLLLAVVSAADAFAMLNRRAALSSGAAAALLGAASGASAAEFPLLGKFTGPFERDPNEAVIVGNLESDESKQAKAKIIALQQEAEDALDKLEKNPQEDLSGMVQKFGIADLREATNIVNNLMDESTAAGTQRLQRLMIQAKYQFEDDIPFPVSQKGVVQSRGEKRLERIKTALKEYIKRSKELLAFI